MCHFNPQARVVEPHYLKNGLYPAWVSLSPPRLVLPYPDHGRQSVGQIDLPHVERDIVLLADVIPVVPIQDDVLLGPDRQWSIQFQPATLAKVGSYN